MECSSWTKKQKLQQHVYKHLENIADRTKQIESECDNSSSPERHEEHGDDGKDLTSEFHEEYFFNIDDKELNGENDKANNTFTNECSSNEEHGELDDHDLREFLYKWAAKSQITTVALIELLAILRKFHPSLPKDPRTLTKTPKVDNIKLIAGGQYYHFGIATCITQQLDQSPIMLGNQISIFVNVNGLTLFKSSTWEFWPIHGNIQSDFKTEPFVIGLFYGSKKPKNVHEYLEDFVSEMLELQENGLQVNGTLHQVNIAGFICDTPARAFVKYVKGHSGYAGCDKCTVYGYHDGRMTYPETNAPLRTDVAFDEMVDDEHHRDRSPLSRLGIGMVSLFPLDYMHLVCLGVMKGLIKFWIKGPLGTCRIGATANAQIAEKLMYKSFMPREFVCKPRDFSEVDRWKATEFRQFLLHTGPVCLLHSLHEIVYKNFLLLSVGIHYLADPNMCFEYANYAKDRLVDFVQHTSKLWWNQHSLQCSWSYSLGWGCKEVWTSWQLLSWTALAQPSIISMCSVWGNAWQKILDFNKEGWCLPQNRWFNSCCEEHLEVWFRYICNPSGLLSDGRLFTYPIKSSKIVIKKRYWPSKKTILTRYQPILTGNECYRFCTVFISCTG